MHLKFHLAPVCIGAAGGGSGRGHDMQVKSQGIAGDRRVLRRGIVAGAAALLLVGASHQALAQSASPGSVIVLDTIDVSADAAVEGSTLSERLSVLPGGVALVERDELARTASRRGSGQKDQSTPNKSSTMISESGTPRSQRMMGIVAVPVSVCVAKQTTKQAMRSRLS